ncbi:MAG: ABC transporter ATP-binding protein [Flavobacterium sp. BFFFF2]|nr:MAG: ABC transporter ATP-binding protein [Flavobacterium sp. BFFFF2]
MSIILETQSIGKRFGTYTALDHVSLQIPTGSIFGLLGPNGAGKTTLIRIINQIITPDTGMVLLDGSPLKPADVSQIGYMPEERGLYKSMKVGEQCVYLAQLKGMPKKEAESELKKWFVKWEIEGWWNKKIQELSKGMAQKVQFIVTVLHKPKLLILDEPFSGFDPVNAALIRDEILRLNQEGTSILFSTHRMETVEDLCDHIALIHQSKALLQGPVDEIKRAFRKHTYTVEIEPDSTSFNAEIQQRFSAKPTHFKSLNQGEQWEIHLGNHSVKETLHWLNAQGTVSHFSEKMPSIHDIFIQTVTQKPSI